MDANSLTQTFSSENLRFIAFTMLTLSSLIGTLLTILSPLLLRRQKSLMERSKRETKLMGLMDGAADKAERALAVAEHVADPVKQNDVAQEALLQIVQILRS